MPSALKGPRYNLSIALLCTNAALSLTACAPREGTGREERTDNSPVQHVEAVSAGALEAQRRPDKTLAALMDAERVAREAKEARQLAELEAQKRVAYEAELARMNKRARLTGKETRQVAELEAQKIAALDAELARLSKGGAQAAAATKVYDFSELAFSSDAVGSVKLCAVQSVRNLIAGRGRPAYPEGTVARATLTCNRDATDASRGYDQLDLALKASERYVLDTPEGSELEVLVIAQAGSGYARMPVVSIP